MEDGKAWIFDGASELLNKLSTPGAAWHLDWLYEVITLLCEICFSPVVCGWNHCSWERQLSKQIGTVKCFKCRGQSLQEVKKDWQVPPANSIKTASQAKLLFDLVLKGDRCLLSNEVTGWYAGIWEGRLMFLETHREVEGAEGPCQRWAPARGPTWSDGLVMRSSWLLCQSLDGRPDLTVETLWTHACILLLMFPSKFSLHWCFLPDPFYYGGCETLVPSPGLHLPHWLTLSIHSVGLVKKVIQVFL